MEVKIQEIMFIIYSKILKLMKYGKCYKVQILAKVNKMNKNQLLDTLLRLVFLQSWTALIEFKGFVKQANVRKLKYLK